jgi:hypothetical protein
LTIIKYKQTLVGAGHVTPPKSGVFSISVLKTLREEWQGIIADFVKCKNKQKQRHAYQHTFIVTKRIL